MIRSRLWHGMTSHPAMKYNIIRIYMIYVLNKQPQSYIQNQQKSRLRSQMLVAGMANMLLGHQNSWVEPYLDSSSLGDGGCCGWAGGFRDVWDVRDVGRSWRYKDGTRMSLVQEANQAVSSVLWLNFRAPNTQRVGIFARSLKKQRQRATESQRDSQGFWDGRLRLMEWAGGFIDL